MKVASKWLERFLLAARRFSAINQLNVTALAVYNGNLAGAEIFSTRSLECRAPPY